MVQVCDGLQVETGVKNNDKRVKGCLKCVRVTQSDDTDTTAANEDEGLQQQPNNTRANAHKAKRELALPDKARCVRVGVLRENY